MSDPDSASTVKVELYTFRFCPNCMRAKGLLDRKKVNYSEYAVDNDHAARASMSKRTKGKDALPQIFINDRSIGGLDDLFELDRTGYLDKLLGLNE